MKNQTLKRVLELAKPHKKTIAITSFLSLIIGIGEIVKPYLIEIAIDEYISKGIFQRGIMTVGMLGGVYIGIVILGNIIDFITTTTVNLMGEDVIYTLRNRLFKFTQNANGPTIQQEQLYIAVGNRGYVITISSIPSRFEKSRKDAYKLINTITFD